jgi:hypothetical protein
MLGDVTGPFPWELTAGESIWKCSNCGTTCPAWDACTAFRLCAHCDLEQRIARRVIVRRDNPEPLQPLRPAGTPSGYRFVGKPYRVRETGKAVLYALPDGAKWIPKYAIRTIAEGVCVPHWLYRKLFADSESADKSNHME